MASLSDHSSGQFTKFLLIGDSGTGKTGALASLVAADYRVRILDFDNGLSALVQEIKRTCPDKLANVDYITLRDQVRSSPAGPVITPKAFVKGLGRMNKWDDDSIPAEWGPKTIFVLDSLTRFSDAAFNWAKGMNPTSKDPRQWYGAAQSAVEDTLSLITSEAFATNVAVISHISWQDVGESVRKGYTSAVGKALGPIIPTYFDNLVMMKTTGTGSAVRRVLQTTPTHEVDLKNPVTFKLAATLPIETGLATFFETVRS